MERNPARVRVGIGGWEHEILDRVLYGETGLSPEEKLTRYAETFDTAVTRPTFWDEDLRGESAGAWAHAVRRNSSFQFIVKLHHRFTHERTPGALLRQRTREILQVLDGEGRLGALMAQFPFCFTNTSANRFTVVRLAEIFRGFPRQVEFRQASWCQPPVPAFLEEHGAQIVSADLPRIRQLMPFHSSPRGTDALLRLHGRNERGWLQNAFEARYDYLYNAREIIEIRRRIESMMPAARRITVVFNNTTGGHAVANALQLLSALHGGKPLTVPPATLTAFAQLRQIADPAGMEEGLFDSRAFRTAM